MAAAATSIDKDIRELEMSYWNAVKSSDSGALSKLTADQFTFVMKEGVNNFSRADFVKMMTGEDFKMTAFAIDEKSITVREFGPAAALAAYSAHWEFDRGGKPEKHDTVNASFWIKESGAWKCAAVSEADAPK